MVISSSPIASRRLLEETASPTSAAADDSFTDMVDENLARRINDRLGGLPKNPDVCAAGAPLHHSSFVDNKVVETTQKHLHHSPSRQRHQYLTVQRSPIIDPIDTKKIGNNMANANVGDMMVSERSALAPRSDAQANGVSPASYLEPISPTTAKEHTMPPRPPVSTGHSRTSSFDNNPDRNRIPRNPRDGAESKQRKLSSNVSIKSHKSGRSVASGVQPHTQTELHDPESQEQALFEQRLCEDAYGVAVRKINANGKSQLRYVKCVPYDPTDDDHSNSSTASRSVASSLKRAFSRGPSKKRDLLLSGGPTKALSWGRNHKLSLDRFVAVRKGKTTERTRKNPQPASRLLTLLTDDNQITLDIEAPTRLDRDKFARAFSRFLQVPLEAEEMPTAPVSSPRKRAPLFSANVSAPEIVSHTSGQSRSHRSNSVDGYKETIETSPGTSLGILASQTAAIFEANTEDDEYGRSQNDSSAPSKVFTGAPKEPVIEGGEVVSGFDPDLLKEKDEHSEMSSLTGGNYDQDIVEELHQALEALKVELEESRAEAARAVKVAEQAIQSAENSNSKDWNSTVTHKAAEAAALAQKRSAEAMAKQRLAEERLAGEKKNATFWRKQAEVAEEEAGVLQTRAAAAEVHKAAIMEELEAERKHAAQFIETLKERFASSEVHSRDALDSLIARSRALEMELLGTRRDLDCKNEAQQVSDESTVDASRQGVLRKKFSKLAKPNKKKSPHKEDSTSLLSSGSTSSDALPISESMTSNMESFPAEDIQKLHAEFTATRMQFELLKRTTAEELKALPETSQFWADQASKALVASQEEVNRLRQRLALESSTRRKLLHEVQDLRGNVRVYCRPRPFIQIGTTSLTGGISMPSNEILLLHRERLPTTSETTPLTFEFDRIFPPDMGQKEVYDEVEELVLNALDGYKVCLMSYGASSTGKTFTMIGEVSYGNGERVEVQIQNYGIHLLGARQLLHVARQRSERYEDSFSLTIVEVYDERLCDLIAGTKVGGARGSVEERRGGSKASRRSVGDDEAFSQMSTKSRKLEIRTNNDGHTVVEGIVAVDVESIEDVIEVWKQALTQRAVRLKEQGLDIGAHDAASHVIATLRITSRNIATGIGTHGRIQFVDFAAADLKALPRGTGKPTTKKGTSVDVLAPVGNNNDWKYNTKSISTLLDVVSARAQFMREVPYRNATVSHLLQDSLEGDTKVLMMLCVSCDPKDMQETASALRFAAKMKQVNIGKATKHALPR